MNGLDEHVGYGTAERGRSDGRLSKAIILTKTVGPLGRLACTEAVPSLCL